MLCRKPFMAGVLPFGCGQCLPCRINRRRLWTHRIMLESLKHGQSCFVTLTYSPDKIPLGNSLRPADTQLWLKRVRKAVGSKMKIRYFLVGEYGDHTQRPHYHVALFGLGMESRLLLHEKWSNGHIFVGDLTKDSAQYIAGYVTKKMTSKSDERLKGRYPEFARMSLRPGIGASAMKDVAEVLTSEAGCNAILSKGDVPDVLQHGRKKFPLGRYLRHKLREEVGLNEEICKENQVRRFSYEMRTVFEEAFKDEKSRKKALGQIVTEKSAQKARNQEARMKIYVARKDKL